MLGEDGLVDVAVPGRQEAGGVGLGDHAAVHGVDDLAGADGDGHRAPEGRVVERLDGGVGDEHGRVRRQHVGRAVEVGGERRLALHEVGDAGQEVVRQVDVALHQHVEGDLVAGVDDVDDVGRLDLQVEVLGGPPVVALDPGDAVLGRAVDGVGAGDDRVLVGAGEDLLLGVLGEDVLGHDDVGVQEVVPLLVPRLGEVDPEGQVVDDLDRFDPVPDVVVRDGLDLAEVERVLDVLGGHLLAVAPGDAAAELALVDQVGGPGAGLGQPRGERGLVGVEQEEGLVAEAVEAGDLPGVDRVPVPGRLPRRAGGVEGLVAGELAHGDVFGVLVPVAAVGARGRGGRHGGAGHDGDDISPVGHDLLNFHIEGMVGSGSNDAPMFWRGPGIL